MFIHQVDIKVLDSKLKNEIEAILPDTKLTISYGKELPDVVVAMLVRCAIDDLEATISNTGFDLNHIDMTTNYKSIHAFVPLNHPYRKDMKNTDFKVIEMTGFNLVENKSSWHIEADMLNLITWSELMNGQGDSGYSKPEDPHIWFNCNMCGFWTEADIDDPDYYQRVGGTCTYYRESGIFKLDLDSDFKEIELIFQDEHVIDHFKNATINVFNTPNFREQERFHLD